MSTRVSTTFILPLSFILLAFPVKCKIYQINIDNINKADLESALQQHGTFELVGKSIDNLRPLAVKALGDIKHVLSLPIEVLESVYQQKDFHGFQNVLKETTEKGGQIRNQIAFHFKPYKPSRMPQGMSDGILRYYYEAGMVILHRLYREISAAFDNKNMSDLENDTRSVLSSRRYFENEIESSTGIPAHSDYGLLTLVTSDKPGLSVKCAEEWIEAECEPKLRFYVNVGDWMLFQLARPDFIAGVHRVLQTKEERHSMALFLNPPFDQVLKTPKGIKASFKDFLYSDKTPYMAQ